jgi:hypothetical protein
MRAAGPFNQPKVEAYRDILKERSPQPVRISPQKENDLIQAVPIHKCRSPPVLESPDKLLRVNKEEVKVARSPPVEREESPMKAEEDPEEY